MRGDAGLSLVELVVAMALFALVAVMGMQALTGTIRLSERLTRIDAATEEVGLATALIRSDLESLVPMLFYPPQAAPRPPVAQSPEGGIGLSLAGRATLGSHTDRGRAEWALDGGTLTRRAWPTLLPAAPGQRGAAAPVLTGVAALRLRTFWPGTGWVDGAAPPLGALAAQAPRAALDADTAGPPPAIYWSGLPRAVEVALDTEAHGTLRVVERLW